MTTGSGGEGQLMERAQIFNLMGAQIKLYGMRAAYNKVLAAGIKCECEPPRIVGDLLKAEIAEKQAQSIKYRLPSPSGRSLRDHRDRQRVWRFKNRC